MYARRLFGGIAATVVSMRSRLTATFDGVLAKLGLALTASLLTSLYLVAAPVAPTGAATVRPHASSICDQLGAFAYGSSVVGIADRPGHGGYWIVNNAGQVAACGDATFLGQPTTLNRPIVGIAATPDGGGYYLVATDGGIFTYGDAAFQGSTGGLTLNKPIVGMAVDPPTGGYWLVASDGGIFAYNAPFYGSTGSITLNKPVVGMAAERDGRGYWFVASDGGIFAYGVPFFGSTGSLHLNKPVVGMAVDAIGAGYYLVASDGGIFAYNAPFLGSAGSIALNEPIVGMDASSGYRFIAADGGVFSYGTQFYGTPIFALPPAPPAPAPTPTPGAFFSCTGSVPAGGVDISYGTSSSNFAGANTVPWSNSLGYNPNVFYYSVNAILLGGGGSVTCTTTVTWPGGSVTQTGSAVGAYESLNAEVCSDFSGGWQAC
jgi:hypothetical protein